MNMRREWIEEGIEALNEPVDFDFEFIGADDCAINRGIESRGVASSGEDADALHRRLSAGCNR
jgi:hypothetical protein